MANKIVRRQPVPLVVGLLRVEVDKPTVLNNKPAIKLVAVRRNVLPRVSELTLPCGFVNEGERAEMAVAREVFDATSIVTHAGQWRPLTTYVMPSNNLLIFMRHIVPLLPVQWDRLQSHATAEPELALVDVGDTLCFPAHHDMLQRKLLWE